MSAGAWATALAPAKVNPWLSVLGRREDGFHEVDTGLLALDLHDEVRVRATRGGRISLRVEGSLASPDVPADERNLAWRAAEQVLELAREAGGVPDEVGLELRLAKRVPSRAGLGGGSSDAAATALAARSALGVSLSWESMAERLAGLGADCAFFLAAQGSGFARCTGRGEVVLALPPVPSRWRIALAVPGFGADTGAVYGALGRSLSRARAATTVAAGFFERSETVVRAEVRNDLEAAALASVPGLSRWRGLLDESGCSHFRLSGSGSSFFGLFEDAEEASRCLAAIETGARGRGMSARLLRVARPAGHGARLVPVP